MESMKFMKAIAIAALTVAAVGLSACASKSSSPTTTTSSSTVGYSK